jgi:hypothetical protein
MSGVAHRSFLVGQLLVQGQRIVLGEGGFIRHFAIFSGDRAGGFGAMSLGGPRVREYRKFAIMS